MIQHLLEIIGTRVELAPDRDHHMGVETMQSFEPSIGVGKPLSVELVGTPGVFLPVLPVLNDVVERYLFLAEGLHYIQTFLSGLVALTRLPKTEGPGRHERRF